MSDDTPKEAPHVVIDDAELARRSAESLGELFSILGQGVGKEAVVRWPNAVGAKFEQGFCPNFFNSVVVPSGTTPPVDDPGSHYVWTEADSVAGRVEEAGFAIPTMGLELNDPSLKLDGAAVNVEEPSLKDLAVVNERAYGEAGFSKLALGIKDPRVHLHGLRGDGEFVCVAMTLSIGDDLGVHFVATEDNYRRRGLASSLVKKLLANARRRGMRSATLQASPDGLPVWERVGFRRVGVVRPYKLPLVTK